MTQPLGPAVPPGGQAGGPAGEACPPLPLAAPAVAVLGLVGELLLLAGDGLRPLNDGLPVSMVLTSAVVAWVSYGVLTGRTVRRVLALVLLGLAAVVDTVDVLLAVVGGRGVDGWDVLYLTASVAMFGALVALVRSPYDAWQRTHHDGSVPGVGLVVVLAAVTGLLGPVAGPGPESGKGFHVQLNLGQEPSSSSDSFPNSA